MKKIINKCVHFIKLAITARLFYPVRFPALINFLLIELQEKVIKPSHVLGYPRYLIIDPGNICNLNCALCPTGQNKKGRPKGFMPFKSFKKIVDELGSFIVKIDLYNWGEPFLNKDIFQMIHYARNKHILVNVSSNMNYFDEFMAEKLVQSGCNELIVSLDGASQESCSKYQVGINFDKVLNNMKTVREKKLKFHRKEPIVVWKFLVNKYNEHEIIIAKKIAKDFADRLEFDTFRCDTAEELFMNNQDQFKNVRNWLPRNERWSMYDYKTKSKKVINQNFCSFLYSQSVINWDGSVSPCCALWYKKWDFGNIFKSGFKNIWNNKYYRSSRKFIFRNQVSNTKTICYICKRNAAII